MLDFHCSYPGTVEGVVEPGMSSSTARNMAILQHIPFVVEFKNRVKVSFCSTQVTRAHSEANRSSMEGQWHIHIHCG